MALEGCSDCCMRWYITINGEECVDPGPIDAAIRQDLAIGFLTVQFDLRRPGTVAGICRGTTEGNLMPSGTYTIGLTVSNCEAFVGSFDTLTGYNSVSRFIIEELPDRDPCKVI